MPQTLKETVEVDDVPRMDECDSEPSSTCQCL